MTQVIKEKVAVVIGRPGMCSDDGRAITYYWQYQTNEYGGKGYYSEPRGHFNEASEARDAVEKLGYKVLGEHWG